MVPTISSLSDLSAFASELPATPRMPVLFLGHGSPMNAIEENIFVQRFRKVTQEIPTPKAILCISAHWFISGTKVTSMAMPRTIHDFYGFPAELYQQNYPAKGSPELAKTVQEILGTEMVTLDESWGLDHGAWSVLCHLYPRANIPVIQLSIDARKDAAWHFDLAQRLRKLRDRGVLIAGSGNIIHHLGRVDFSKINEVGYGYDWAHEANDWVHEKIKNRDWNSLIQYQKQGKAMQLSVPTPDHYLPFIYSIGLVEANEIIEPFNDHLLAGSLSMTSLKIGSKN
jgi:4,5-DOPA dioxygenase extradiol